MISNLASPSLLLCKPCQVLSAAVLIVAWEGKLAAALILPGALLFNVHHDGERERKKGGRVGWAGGLDDMSPYFKSRITNALACAPSYECRLDGG